MRLTTILALLFVFTNPSHARRAPSASSSSSPPSSSAILLSKVKALTFRTGRQTTHRRVTSVPQTSCVGGSAEGLFEPEVIRCENAGADDGGAESVQWTCRASLPPEFRLGVTDVTCEGYRDADDEWVLRGSCGVGYTLELTPVGEQKWPERLRWGGDSKAGGAARGQGGSGEWDDEGGTVASTLFMLFFFGVLGWILFNAFVRESNWWRGRRGPGGVRRGGGGSGGPGGGGGGGGGWYPGDDSNDPPPPYSSHDYSGSSSKSRWSQPPMSQNQAEANEHTIKYVLTPPAPGSAPGSSPWRPGFWTGAAAGAGATYLANSMRGSGAGSSRDRDRDRDMQDRRSGGNSAFGEGGGGGNRRSGGGGGGSGSSGSSGGPSYSSTRYESTGFGETRRR